MFQHGHPVDNAEQFHRGRPDLVVLLQFPRRDLGVVTSGPFALVFARDPEADASPDDALLRGLYGLSPQEAGLARALTRGRTVEEAKAAIAALNGREADGRQLTVNEARPKTEGGGGGGRSRGGDYGSRRY